MAISTSNLFTLFYYLKTSFLSASSLKRIKINIEKVSIEEPPLLKKGKGMPITGANPSTIPIFIMK